MLKKEDDQLIPTIPIEHIDRKDTLKQRKDSKFIRSQKSNNALFKSEKLSRSTPKYSS